MSPHQLLEYTIDRSDAILHVNDAWSAFARANEGSHLLPPDILGRRLWDFVHDDTTHLIYRRLFDRVRAGVGPVRFAFRCDSPSQRRLLRMTIDRDARGDLVLRTLPLAIEARPAIALLDVRETRGPDVVTMCGWCNRLSDARGGWFEVEEALPLLRVLESGNLPRVSHGLCESCARKLEADFDSYAPDGPVLGTPPRH